MQHVFITTLRTAVESWLHAFPEAIVLTALEDERTVLSGTATFWVHAQLEQGTKWLVHVQALLQRFPASKVIVLSNNPDQREAFQALGVGAVGYLHAYSHQNLLKEVASVVAHGGVWLGQDLLKTLIEMTVPSTGHHSEHANAVLERLTHREREVALEAAKGLSNKEIARDLAISERTVKAHLTSVFETLQVKDRLHLALILQGASASERVENVNFPLQRTRLN